MSVEAITWASKLSIGSSGAKFLLVAIANYSNAENKAWPSQKTLSDWTEMSDRSIRTHMTLLESLGLISRQKRSIDGSFLSDMITLNVGKDLRKILPTENSSDGKKCQIPAENFATYPSLEPSLINKEKRARGNQFPEDFSPNETHHRLGKELGIDPESQIQPFKDFHKSKGTVFSDWDAGFRTWMRNAYKFSTPQNKNKFTGTKAERQQQDKDWLNAATGKNKRIEPDFIDIAPA